MSKKSDQLPIDSVKSFVNQVIIEIEEAMPPGYEIEDGFDFEVSLIANKKAKGGLKLEVVGGELAKENQSVHKVSFSISNPSKKKKATEREIKSQLLMMKNLWTSLYQAGEEFEKKKIKSS